MLIILGNKYKLNKMDIKILEEKFNKVKQIPISSTYQEIINRIDTILQKDKIKCIVLNLESNISLSLESYLEELSNAGYEILIFSELCTDYLDKTYVEFNEKNFKVIQDINYNKSSQLLKRVFDILFSLFALITLLPFMVIIAMLIKIYSPGAPIFFTQQRLGKNGKFFRVYKFRSMIPNAEKVLADIIAKDQKIKDEYLKYRKLKEDPRIIPFIGNKLRNYSLDELPQFLNILLGDMSVVGPRPYIALEFEKHSLKYINIITSVKPGITGYWQVKGRSNTTFNDRVKMDIAYIKNRTFFGDVAIVFQTISVMIFKKGAS